MSLMDRVTERVRHPALSETDIYVVKTMISVGWSTSDIAETFGYTERLVEAVASAISNEAVVT